MFFFPTFSYSGYFFHCILSLFYRCNTFPCISQDGKYRVYYFEVLYDSYIVCTFPLSPLFLFVLGSLCHVGAFLEHLVAPSCPYTEDKVLQNQLEVLCGVFHGLVGFTRRLSDFRFPVSEYLGLLWGYSNSLERVLQLPVRGYRFACCCFRVRGGKGLKHPQFSTSLTLVPVFCPLLCLASQGLTRQYSVPLENKPPVASSGWESRRKQGREEGCGVPR